MKRRTSGMEFAEVWGRVCRWPAKDVDDLISLLNTLGATKGTEPRKREARKPRGGPAEVAP